MYKLVYEKGKGLAKKYESYHGKTAVILQHKKGGWVSIKVDDTEIMWRTTMLQTIIQVQKHSVSKLIFMNADASARHVSLIKNIYNTEKPDLFSICELPLNTAKRLGAEFSGMDFVCDQLDYAGDSILACFNKQRYTLHNNTFESSRYGKYISMVLDDLHTNKAFLWVCVHLPRRCKTKYFKAVELLLKHVHEKNLPFIICGDFNVSWKAIESDFKLKSVVKESTTSNKNREGIDNAAFSDEEVICSYERIVDTAFTHTPIKIEFVY
jgi:exonuclease III